MASDGDIEGAVNEMLAYVSEKAPNLGPAIFLKHQIPSKVTDLCSNAKQRALLESKWSQRDASSVVFVTEVDYRQKTIFLKEIRTATNDLDAKLGSLEAIMKMCVEGGEEEVTVTTSRFLEVNGYSGENKTDKYILQHVYNVAYAVKVLLSNAPIRVAINFKKRKQILSLPLADDVDVLEVIESITHSGVAKAASKQDTKRKLEADDSDDSSDSEDDGERDAGKKRRKKKRGSGKKR